MKFYVAQAVGLAGMALAFISFQKNDKRKILWIQASAALVFAVHFMLLEAFTGVFMNLLEVPRDLIFAHRHGSLRRNVLAAAFISAFVFFGIVTWEDLFSFFPVLAMGLSTIVFTMKNPRSIRICMLPVSALWMTYNILVFSLAGVLTESFCLFSLLLAIFRFDILKKGENRDVR